MAASDRSTLPNLPLAPEGASTDEVAEWVLGLYHEAAVGPSPAKKQILLSLSRLRKRTGLRINLSGVTAIGACRGFADIVEMRPRIEAVAGRPGSYSRLRCLYFGRFP
jgi:hypothetical protein